MIKESEIRRLRDEKREEILKNDGKLGLYNDNYGETYRELAFVTTRISLDGVNAGTMDWNHYAEWQAPPKDERSCKTCEHNDVTYPRHPCKNCNNFSGYVKAKAKPTPKPLTQKEIAHFILDNGLMLCHQCDDDVIYNCSIDIDDNDLENYRYLKPNSKELHKLKVEEVRGGKWL